MFNPIGFGGLGLLDVVASIFVFTGCVKIPVHVCSFVAFSVSFLPFVLSTSSSSPSEEEWSITKERPLSRSFSTLQHSREECATKKTMMRSIKRFYSENAENRVVAARALSILITVHNKRLIIFRPFVLGGARHSL